MIAILAAVIGALVGAAAVLPIGLLQRRANRSRGAAELEMAKQWFIDRYEQISYFDGQFLRLLHAIQHVTGDRPGSDWESYENRARAMCTEMRDRARAEVATVGKPFVLAVEKATDAALAWLQSAALRRLTRQDGSDGFLKEEQAFWAADERWLRARRELLEEKLPPALKTSSAGPLSRPPRKRSGPPAQLGSNQ